MSHTCQPSHKKSMIIYMSTDVVPTCWDLSHGFIPEVSWRNLCNSRRLNILNYSWALLSLWPSTSWYSLCSRSIYVHHSSLGITIQVDSGITWASFQASLIASSTLGVILLTSTFMSSQTSDFPSAFMSVGEEQTRKPGEIEVDIVVWDCPYLLPVLTMVNAWASWPQRIRSKVDNEDSRQQDIIADRSRPEMAGLGR